ncbi:hypothetical protein CsatB_019572 [Cannabis sativa]
MPLEQDDADAQSAIVILSQIMSEDSTIVCNDTKYLGRISVFLDQEDGEFTSTRTILEKDGESVGG